MKELLYFRALFLASFILLTAAASLIVPIMFSGESVLLILHFTPERGANVIGGVGEAFGIVFTGIIIACANLLIGRELLPKAKILAMLVSSANFLFSVLILITVSIIIISSN